MKTILFSLLVAASLNVNASNNWGTQHCLRNHGEVLTLDMQWSQFKKIQVCKLGFRSVIEINTLDRSYLNDYGPHANQAYRQTPYSDFQACQRFGGRRSRGVDPQSKLIYNVCEFSDRSAIGEDTLSDGYTSGWNRELNRALGILY